MLVFICEFITGGGLMDRDLPPGLCREGDMMVTALVNDLARLDGMRVLLARDPRLAPPAIDARIVAPAAASDLWPCWQRCIDEADAVWPIAPETGGALERLSAFALERGRLLLASRPEAIHIAASKRATAALLARHGIATVATMAAGGGPLPASDTGWVAKPDDGVGAEGARFFTDGEALRSWLAAGDRKAFVVQPFLEGTPASVSALFRDGRAKTLACNRQDVVIEAGAIEAGAIEGSALRYRGGEVGALERHRPALSQITEAVARALPGLWGYAGIDFVITPRGPIVLEVNPRLTTSYAGLGQALDQNPAALVLDLLKGAPLPNVRPLRTAPIVLPADERERAHG